MVSKKGLGEFNISNNIAYLLIGVLSVVFIGVGVYAWGATDPNLMGHSAGEIDSTGCTTGQKLTWSGTGWVCQDAISLPTCGPYQILRVPEYGGIGWVCQDYIQVYQCPISPPAIDCTNIQLLRNGVEYCHGQLSSSTSCYVLNPACEYDENWGTCTPIGITPPVCGDGICDSKYETCFSCSRDCPPCVPSPCELPMYECFRTYECVWDNNNGLCRQRVCEDFISPTECGLAISYLNLGCHWDYNNEICSA